MTLYALLAYAADDGAVGVEPDDPDWVALDDADTATTVRVRDGTCVVTDGPSGEAAEALAGFWVLDAPDLDAVLDVARRHPASGRGSVEIRPVRA